MTNSAARFDPSRERAALLDSGMRARLSDSLEYLFGQVGSDLDVDRDEAARCIADIRDRAQAPHRFGAYYDLVFAIEGNDLDEARRLANEIFSTSPSPATTRIATIEDRPAPEAERYRRLLISDPGMAGEPDAALAAECNVRMTEAFALLDAGYPEMADEIRGLLREIVVAAGPEDPKALTFDGASSYMMWGAILLNARGQKTVLDTAQALAHESGHNLLFGFCASGPLVDNPDDELFSSPLRKDARPMDGVFHATYVVARMHQTLTRLVEAGVLNDEQMEAARKDLALHRRNFEAGDHVVREGARLTEVGAMAIEAARAHMASSN